VSRDDSSHRPSEKTSSGFAVDAKGCRTSERGRVPYTRRDDVDRLRLQRQGFRRIGVIQRRAFSGGITAPRGAPTAAPWPLHIEKDYQQRNIGMRMAQRVGQPAAIDKAAISAIPPPTSDYWGVGEKRGGVIFFFFCFYCNPTSPAKYSGADDGFSARTEAAEIW